MRRPSGRTANRINNAPDPKFKTRKVGDRVSWSASPSSWECRTVYTGEILRYENDLAVVRDDGWGAESAVHPRPLHDEDAYEVTKSGPRGILWKD